MQYEDDELERMRARREQRRNAGRNLNGSGTGSSGSSEAGYGRRSQTSGSSRRETDYDRSVSGRSDGGNRTGSSRRRTESGSGAELFKSGYSGPKDGSGARSGGNRRQSDPRRRRQSEKNRKRKILIAEILVLVFLIIGGGLWYLYDRTFGSLAEVEFDETVVMNPYITDEQKEEMKGYMTVACFGVDSRMENGKLNVGKGTNADVNLIASVNLDTGEIRLVSVFRDTYLNVNDKNSYNKINYAYAQGGPEQAVKALNKNLGLNITQYATFNWKAVADAINLLGGVDITLSEAEFSWINAYITETVQETGVASVQLTHAGDVHLDGVQAVAYGRLRLGDTDYARTERQRIILAKAFEKAKAADWATVNNIIYTVMPQLATNVTITDLVPLARKISSFHMGDTAGFPSARTEMDIGKIGDCVVPATLEFNVQELHKFLFDKENYEVPDNVKEYSAYISETTGVYSEGKVIGHVPVDQGVSAAGYIKRRAEKAAAAAAAEAESKAASQKSTAETDETDETDATDETDETDESETGETDENGDLLDPDEDWLDHSDWNFDDEDFDEEDGEDGPGSTAGNGPGDSSTVRPGTSYTKPGTSYTKPGSDSTKADTDSTKADSSNKSGSTVKPGSTTSSSDGVLIVPAGTSKETEAATSGPSGSSDTTSTIPADKQNNSSSGRTATTEAASGPGGE